jgi:hypothetical protein
MLERGLSVLGPRGDIHLSPVRATGDPGSIGEKASPFLFVRFGGHKCVAPVRKFLNFKTGALNHSAEQSHIKSPRCKLFVFGLLFEQSIC